MKGDWQTAIHSIDPDRYRSYLLRLWREAPGAPWRCQVQCVGSGDERRFAGIQEMFQFLLADAASASSGADGSASTSDTACKDT
jgi:hypothetical protein